MYTSDKRVTRTRKGARNAISVSTEIEELPNREVEGLIHYANDAPCFNASRLNVSTFSWHHCQDVAS